MTFTLPPEIEAALVAHCMDTGDDPASVLADAVTLHLDPPAEVDEAAE